MRKVKNCGLRRLGFRGSTAPSLGKGFRRSRILGMGVGLVGMGVRVGLVLGKIKISFLGIGFGGAEILSLVNYIE